MLKSLFLLLLLPLAGFAQTKYQVNDIVVTRGGNPMQNPWIGGLNNPVFSPIDIDQDGKMDLYVYDKAGWKSLVLLNTGTAGHPSYTYAPQYDRMFPSLLDWALIRDYDHDGIGDIFALTANRDIAVYKGYRSGSFLGYTLTYPHLSYLLGALGTPSIWTFPDNMPVIMDVDGDGDLDILAPDMAGGLSLDFYKNLAVDSGYRADSLYFTISDPCWGRFVENSNNCGVTMAQCKKELHAGGSLRHQGGAVFGFHYTNDHVTSLLLADFYCPSMKFLRNMGDSIYSSILYVDSIFPQYDVPVNTFIFPAAYGIDADNDGYEDLFISPFASNANQQGQSQDVNVLQYYHNMGIDSVNKFHYMGDTVLTNGIIDVGSESHPVFFDYNGDGLMDIVTGNYGRFSTSGAPRSALALYVNIGSDTVPQYKEQSLDWNGLSVLNINGLYPAFGDMDGDGHADMVIGDAFGNIHFFHNSGISAASYPSMTQRNWFGINVGLNAAPYIYDVNGDGLNDLVIGTKGTNLLYYWNYGTATNPLFSSDSVNPFFGKIRVYDTHVAGQPPGYATAHIQRESNQTFIYSGSQRGWIYKYAINMDSLRKGTFVLIDSNVLGSKPGLRSTVSIADINHDGSNEYLCGNIRGGMTIYSDLNWGHLPYISGISDPAVESNTLAVYPNPANDRFVCKMTDVSSKIRMVKLYDLLGETLYTTELTAAENMINVSVADLADGIYVLQVVAEDQRAYQTKISIFKK